MSTIITILQEMFDIISGATQYLPSTTITIGVTIGLIILIYFQHTLGGLVTGILITILIAHSFSVSYAYSHTSGVRAADAFHKVYPASDNSMAVGRDTASA